MAVKLSVLLESPQPQVGNTTPDLAQALERHWRSEPEAGDICTLESVAVPDTLGFELTGVVFFLVERWDQIASIWMALRGLVSARGGPRTDITIELRSGDRTITIEGKKLLLTDLDEWRRSINSLSEDFLGLQ